MTTAQYSPQEWARETWATSPLELLIPAAAGVSLFQLICTVFVLRSYGGPLFLLFLAASLYATFRSLWFLYELNRDSKTGATTYLRNAELAHLVTPLLLSAVLYASLVPSPRYLIVFVLLSLPNALFLTYLARTYARVVGTVPAALPSLPALPALDPLFTKIGQVSIDAARAPVALIRSIRIGKKPILS